MYTDFYGLKAKPFSLTPDPTFLYLSAAHQKCATILQYGILNNTGFTVVSGEIGSGKSTLIQYLLNTVDTGMVTIGHINNTFKVHDDLLAWVLDAFDISVEPGTTRINLHRMFTEFVVGEYAEGRRVALIIDEAQNLDVDSIEELRLLSNINIAEDIILQMIFVGQPELIDVLEDPRLKQFAQRIGIEFNIPPLNYGETKQYIHHRLTVAGAERRIFDEEASAALYCYSGGLPRKLNNLCDMALVYGFAEEAEEITAKIINDTISDRMKSGLFRLDQRGYEEIRVVEEWLSKTKNIKLIST